MREWLAVEEVCYALASFGGIYGFQALREWARSGITTQRQRLWTSYELLNGSPQLGPVLNLSSDRAFHRFTSDPRVQNERIGKFNRLTHVNMVA